MERNSFNRFLRKNIIIIILYTIICFVASGYFYFKGKSFNKCSLTEQEIEISETEDGLRYSTVPIFLNPGNYACSVTYSSDEGGTMNARIDNDTFQFFALEGTRSNLETVTYLFSLDSPTDRAIIDLFPKSNITIADITFISDKPLNTDSIFIATIMLLLPILLSIIFYQVSNRDYTLLRLCLITALTCIPLILDDGLRFTIDVRDHLQRLQGIYTGLLDGQFPVIIYPNMSNEHGQLGALYPALFLYLGALLRLMGVSICITYKFLVVIINFATVLSVSYCVKKLYSNENVALLVAVLYAFDPERMYAIYRAGGALGAGIAAIFIPLVIYGLISIIFDNKKDWKALAIGMAGIMCSHVVSMLMMIFFLVFILLLNIKKLWNKEIWFSFIKALALFLSFSIGTIVPFIRFYFSDWGKDNLRWTTFNESTLKFSELFEINQRWFPLFFLLIFFLYKIGTKSFNIRDWDCQFAIISIVTCCSVMNFFPWDILYRMKFIEAIMTTIQETHRVYAVLAFPSALFAGNVLNAIIDDKKKSILVGVLFVLSICSICDATNRYLKTEVLFFDAAVGNIISRQAEDYLPRGTETEWYNSSEGYVSDTEAVNTLEYTKRGTHVSYSYTSKNDCEFVELPLFYYEGYCGVNQAGKKIQLIKSSHNKVQYNCKKTENPDMIHIQYEVAPIYSICYGFSILSILMFIICEFISMRKNKLWQMQY